MVWTSLWWQYRVTKSHSCASITTGVYPGNIRILSGTNDLLDASNENYIYPVAYIINYPDYKPNKFWKNDICILRLEKPIYYTTKCKNIHLPVHSLGQVNDATISGWGHDFDIPTSPSRYLKMTHVTVLTKSKCNYDLEEFAFTMSNTQKCAITQNTNAGIQRGDAGSAVTHTFRADGIISLQIPNKKYAFIFTQVWSYLDWIEGMIEEY
ncbi:hypothetical protein HCN44_002263 [Aphidius gifuensis]|uniref:Peptidase S1 domain-containing protein n=1 Tax=Aphidius gifuensis TaxID=684658 RepID=A0A835CUN1_APHGI|nr:putative trypsin-6 [Aphidius gifuensis]KAF7996617.1 hypothetical protein HCN44_002263 [Aphidius gifuensis]